jgi:hypothetical protein
LATEPSHRQGFAKVNFKGAWRASKSARTLSVGEGSDASARTGIEINDLQAHFRTSATLHFRKEINDLTFLV